MMLRAVEPLADCACVVGHLNGSAIFCSCGCHVSPPLTEAVFARGVRAISEGSGFEVPERFKAVREIE